MAIDPLTGKDTLPYFTTPPQPSCRRYHMFGYGFPVIRMGAGAPTTEPTDVTGSLYLRTDGGVGSTLYVFETSGWTQK